MNTLAMVLMAQLKVYFSAFANEEGQGMAEYALIIALVAIVLAASLTQLSGGITGVFTSIVSAFGGGS